MREPDAPEDRALRPGTSPGEEFDQLFRPLIPALFRHAFRWTAARDRAEDLVQDLLARLYPRLAELRQLDRLEPWAVRVMYRIFVDQYRREQNAPVRPMHELGDAWDPASGDPYSQFPDDMPQPPELVDREILGQRLAAAWTELAHPQRVVVALHDIEGYRLDELARILEVPVGTVKSRLHRARARLRELLCREPYGASVRVSEQETDNEHA